MDINELIRASVQEVLAETQTQNTEPTATQTAPQPIQLNIQGQTYTFKDQAELEAQLNQVAIAQRQAAVQPPPAPAPQVSGGRVTGDEDSSFSNEEYIRLMNEDPRKATKYALSHVLFDGKVEDPTELLRETMVAQAATNRQLAVYQFKDAYKEIPIENPQVGNAIEQIRTELGLPFTPQGLEAAYLFGVGKGRLPDFKAVAANQQQQQSQTPQYQPQVPYNSYQQQQGQNPYLNAPPAPGRSTTASVPVTEEQIENMSVEQLAKLMYRLQSQGAV